MSNEESPETAPHDEDAPATAPAAPAPGRRRQSASGSAAAVIASAADSPRPVVIEPTTPSRSFWTRIDRPFVFGFLVTLGGLGAIVIGLALSNLSTVLIYIALALFGALGLDPAVRFLERRGLSRVISVVITILALIVVFALVIWMIVPVVIDQIVSFVQSVPGMIKDFTHSDIYGTLEAQFGDQFQDLVAQVQSFLTDFGNLATIGGGALAVGASIATSISGAIVVLVLTLYFLASLPTMKQGMLRLAPARDRARAGDIADQITDSVGGYVMGMVILAFCNATLAFLLYLFLGLPFPPLMAAIAFCITLIPLVGSVLFWILGTCLALFTNPIAALVFAAIYLVYMQIEAYVITPRVMNKAVSVPGSLVVIGALAGGTLLGLLGALVAVPVTASILIIIKQVLVPKQDARI
ncbi:MULTISPECIES: AI-2E family transporter [Microbacterium]|uniref:AI-2E family transporter n=2 Tax=Bacteria TaxID=2 RepID=A0A4Y4B0N9_MICMQ|nr:MULTISPECIES: AI-2E family transporter [Microbacterium]QYG12255.1 AI-2E family transporter [Microbacterium sp. PAMC22086]GEC73916.1 AI-2E family transporter [Microbacterium liquefaciens]GGV48175.1 AI-2E family transporter [Microbacterium liquefaciens]